MNRTVKIGPSFFAKAKNDYSNWRFAIAREFIQNSIDAAAKKIEIEVAYDSKSNETLVSFADDGGGMDEKTLTEKLLALGESGKDFAGTVGGFGKAKEILYFSHNFFRICTRDLVVEGAGANYSLEKREYAVGTQSTIMVEGNEQDHLINEFRRVIEMTQWRGEFYLNNERLVGSLKKGAFRKELDWCKIYTNKSFLNRMIVRIGGIVMFHRHVSADDRCVIVELKGDSGQVLQSSRDILKWEYQRELEELVREITIDKKSAFRSDRTYYTHYEGKKLVNYDRSALPEIAKIQNELREMANAAPVPGDNEEESETIGVDNAPLLTRAASRVDSGQELSHRHVEVVNAFRHDFVIRNDAAMQIPDYYKPGNFSAYADKLVRAWVKLIMECYRTFGRVEPFSVGFCFDDAEDTWAMHEKTSDYGRVFYINPAKVVLTQTGVRVFAKRWGFTPSMKYNLIVTAVHEYVHGLGYSYHDERYVQKLDECIAVVMKNLKRFRACFT